MLDFWDQEDDADLDLAEHDVWSGWGDRSDPDQATDDDELTDDPAVEDDQHSTLSGWLGGMGEDELDGWHQDA